MLQNKLSFSMALGVGNKASNSKASYFNTGYHPCLRGKDCIFFFLKYRFRRNKAFYLELKKAL